MKTFREKLKGNKYLFSTFRSLFLLYARFLTFVSPTLNSKFIYRVRFGRNPDLVSPKSLNEKVLFLKLHRFNKEPLSKKCADKYAVRSYVESCGLGDILIPLIAHYDNPEDIEWSKLPNRFFVKWNFGTGLNIRCEDKEVFDSKKATKQLINWKNNKDYLVTSELLYNCEKKQILVEENLSKGDVELPEDYKVFCFNGKPLFVMLCFDRHLGHAKFLMYDRFYNFMPTYTYDGMNYNFNREQRKPEGFDTILKYAEILATPFEFARVDFYIIEGNIFFGEITLTPSAGRDLDITPEFDELAGSLINLKDKYDY